MVVVSAGGFPSSRPRVTGRPCRSVSRRRCEACSWASKFYWSRRLVGWAAPAWASLEPDFHCQCSRRPQLESVPIEPQTFVEAASGHRDFRSPGHSYTGDTLPTLTCRSGSRTLPALRFSATWGALALSGSRNCGTCDGCCSTGTEEDPEGSSPRIVGRERVLAKKARASPFSSSEAGLYSTIQPWRARRHAK